MREFLINCIIVFFPYTLFSQIGYSVDHQNFGIQVDSCVFGIYSFQNTYGFHASTNQQGFRAIENNLNGFLAQENVKDGLHSIGNQGYAAYLNSPDSRSEAAVYISHEGDKKDLRFGGHARIKAEGSFTITLDDFLGTGGQSFQVRDRLEAIVFKVKDNGEGDFNGRVCAPDFVSCSDSRYKKNITPLNNSLSNLSLINGVEYDWDKDKWPNRTFTERPQIGFIAQEVEAIYPELVHTDEEGYKSLAYNKMTVILVEAVKELSQKLINENEELKLEISEANKLIRGLMQRVEKLEMVRD